MTAEYLTKLQEKELEILDFITDFCEQENISYFLTDGTLLGVVRHQGFIPWDDDIDLGMSRSDYERFLPAFQKHIQNSKYVLEATEIDGKSVLNFAKVHDTTTKLVQRVVQEADNQQHVFVDIFPFDKEPDNKLLGYLQWGKTRLLSFLLNVRAKIARESAKKFPLNLLVKALELRYHNTSNEELLQKRKAITMAYNKKETKNYSNIVLSKPKTCLILSKDIKETQFLPFGKKEYRVPKNPDYYLSSYYGDYMTLPPVEQRVNFHDLVYLEIDGIVFDKTYFEKERKKNHG